MNIEIFVAVLAALVVYRVLSPLIDAVNPLTFLTKPKAFGVAPHRGEGAGVTVGRGQ